MNLLAAYDPSTGMIHQTMSGNPEDWSAFAAGRGLAVVPWDGALSAWEHYIQDGLAVAIPASPGPLWTWSWATHSWVPPGLPEARLERWADIRARRDAAETNSTFECDGAEYDSAPLRVSGGSQAAQIALAAGAPFEITWTLADNTAKVLDAAGMIRVGLAQLAHINALHERSRVLRAAIDAAVTLEEISAIQW